MMRRKTKIVATIGPASESREILTKLFDEGLDTARLNFSHDTHASHARRIRAIRELEKKTGKAVAIIADLQGPKMRVGNMPEEGILLHEGEDVLLDTTIETYNGEGIPMPSPIFAKGAGRGSRVFLDDGSLLLQITATKGILGRQFIARVHRGGTLYSHKGINVPELRLRRNIFEKKDHDDMDFALSQKVDYVAISFVRSADDIRFARKIMGTRATKLIAKIERPEALDNLEEIIKEADAVMVARGDLGIETPLWQLPVRQKEIIEKAHLEMKPVIVATQMLESMTRNSIPTRAEVSDVANAVYDSSDAVMLSAETASGKHPVEALRTMRQILEATGQNVKISFEHERELFHSITMAMAKSAKYVAHQVGAKAIIVGTASGVSARAVSRYRPEAPIVAITSSDIVARQLGIIWGVRAFALSGLKTIQDIEKQGSHILKKLGVAKAGDHAVFVSGMRLGKAGETNDISVIKIF